MRRLQIGNTRKAGDLIWFESESLRSRNSSVWEKEVMDAHLKNEAGIQFSIFFLLPVLSTERIVLTHTSKLAVLQSVD